MLPSGLYWSSSVPVMIDEPWLDRQTGESHRPAFPVHLPSAGQPGEADARLRHSIEPITVFARLLAYTTGCLTPSIEFLDSTRVEQFHGADDGLRGNSGPPADLAVRRQSGQSGYVQSAQREGATPTCGPGGESVTYTLPNGQTVNGTRTNLPACVCGFQHGDGEHRQFELQCRRNHGGA